MDWGIVARAVHVLAIVVWIGGVWLITTLLLPAMRQHPPEQWLRDFEAIEQRFAPQARIALIIALLSGLYMIDEYDLWDRFAHPQFWWMHVMVAVWALYALMLFVLEPLVLRRVLHRRRQKIGLRENVADLHLPVMSGLEVCSRLAASDRLVVEDFRVPT